MLSPFYSFSYTTPKSQLASHHPQLPLPSPDSLRWVLSNMHKKFLSLNIHHKLLSGFCISRQPNHLPLPPQIGTKASSCVNLKSSKKVTKQHDEDQVFQFGSRDTRLHGHLQPLHQEYLASGLGPKAMLHLWELMAVEPAAPINHEVWTHTLNWSGRNTSLDTC